jgi:hypothetical protein
MTKKKIDLKNNPGEETKGKGPDDVKTDEISKNIAFINIQGTDQKNRVVTLTGLPENYIVTKDSTGFKKTDIKTKEEALMIFNEQVNSSQNQ